MPIIIVLLVLILLVLLGFPFGIFTGGLLVGLFLLVAEYGYLILIGIVALIILPFIVYALKSDESTLKYLETEIQALENRKNIETNARKLAEVERKLKGLRQHQGSIKRKIRRKRNK